MSQAGETTCKDFRAIRGFTLIELLVVLTVIGLIAAVATPMISRVTPGVELKTSAEEMRNELRLARGAAISGNRESWLTVDVEKGSYWRQGVSSARTLPAAIRLDLLTARREQIDEARGRIRFFPDGTSTGGAIQLRRDGRIVEVAVDWFDGRVSIDDADPE